MTTERFSNAVERNLAELQRAILNRTTLVAIEKESPFSSEFLRLTYCALFNDYVAHCIKVLERSRGCASFWYIYKTDQGPIDKLIRKRRINVAQLETVAEKLKHIRDRTHFHIDFESVKDAKSIWRHAALSGSELSRVVDQLWSILTDVQQRHGLSEINLPASYTVEHVRATVKKIVRSSPAQSSSTRLTRRSTGQQRVARVSAG